MQRKIDYLGPKNGRLKSELWEANSSRAYAEEQVRRLEEEVRELRGKNEELRARCSRRHSRRRWFRA
jgi:phage shock protein A